MAAAGAALAPALPFILGGAAVAGLGFGGYELWKHFHPSKGAEGAKGASIKEAAIAKAHPELQKSTPSLTQPTTEKTLAEVAKQASTPSLT